MSFSDYVARVSYLGSVAIIVNLECVIQVL